MSKFVLEALPYEKNVLEPYISQQTLEFHYGKHHQTYVDNLNKLIAGTAFEDQPLEEIIKKAQGGIFNNAAQVFNHTFYWNCLKANAKPMPEGELLKAIERDFGSFEKFKEDFTAKAVSLFGSGWCWLVKNKDGHLEIVQKSNAGNPLTDGNKPVLVIDVWEHAYYLDKQNARAKYVADFWNIVNWDFVAKQL